ncbi:MAG: anthranilate synthase component I family protein, partial [Gammaproteobacteria bacterium]
SFSPERFIQIRGRNIETRPIKGTRPRGATADDDRAQADALVTSEKDRAENLMIVDLLRNDLGRFCQPGSIRVPELFGLEHYSNVHHLVSTITGTLRDGVFPLDVLAGCSPGGSITGAPKRRAMEIIRELEPVQRGVYCGSLVYMTPEGDLDSSIAIRTLTADGQRLRVWGGGGIVADSDCDAEYEESLTKIRHLIQALEQYRTP